MVEAGFNGFLQVLPHTLFLGSVDSPFNRSEASAFLDLSESVVQGCGVYHVKVVAGWVCVAWRADDLKAFLDVLGTALESPAHVGTRPHWLGTFFQP